MRVLGIDPGLERIGYGVVERRGSQLVAIEHGLVTTPRVEFGERLRALYDEVVALLDRAKPDCVATERLFFAKNQTTAMDVAKAEQDILDAGDELVRRHPDIGAVVLECTNMSPYARALAARLARPVFDIYSFMLWFHAGLAPRDFGPPAGGAQPWRER